MGPPRPTKTLAPGEIPDPGLLTSLWQGVFFFYRLYIRPGEHYTYAQDMVLQNFSAEKWGPVLGVSEVGPQMGAGLRG